MPTLAEFINMFDSVAIQHVRYVSQSVEHVEIICKRYKKGFEGTGPGCETRWETTPSNRFGQWTGMAPTADEAVADVMAKFNASREKWPEAWPVPRETR